MKFTKEQCDSFNEYQKARKFHPFTCGGNRTDEKHLDGEGILVLTEDGLICPYCNYTQNWAHSWMLDSSWRKM
jgi:hypothetical protein